MFDNPILVPFVTLVLLSIYLLYQRNKFEQETYEMFENKLEDWKQTTLKEEATKLQPIDEKKPCGIVYKQNDQLVVEFFENSGETVQIRRD